VLSHLCSSSIIIIVLATWSCSLVLWLQELILPAYVLQFSTGTPLLSGYCCTELCVPTPMHLPLTMQSTYQDICIPSKSINKSHSIFGVLILCSLRIFGSISSCSIQQFLIKTMQVRNYMWGLSHSYCQKNEVRLPD
jgi:hypothetical protein